MLHEKISGIYCIENVVNKKCYVGQSVDVFAAWSRRHKPALKYKRHHNPHLQRAWDKYGESSFRHYLLEECSHEQLDNLEIYYINKLNSMSVENGYNICTGGNNVMACRTHSKASKQKMSTAKRKMSDTTKERISKSRLFEKRARSTSKYQGVSKRIVNKNKNIYWRAGIKIGKKYLHIGNFKQETEAAIAYNRYVTENSIARPLNIIIF